MSSSTSNNNNVDGTEVLKEEELELLERSINTVEEVIEHIQREELSPTDSVLYIMRNSVNVQRIATLQQLHNYIDDNDAEVGRMLRTLVVNIAAHDPPVQVAAAQGVKAIISLLNPIAIMSVFHATQDQLFVVHADSREEWQETYLSIVRILPPEPLDLYVTEFVEKLCQPINSTEQRMFACHLAAEMNKNVNKEATGPGPAFTKLLHNSSMDADAGVRLAVADRLAAIAKHISCVEFRERTLPVALRLLLDDDVRVSAACFSQLVVLTESFDDPIFVRTFLLPIFLRFANHAPPIVEATVFHEFGRMMWNTRSCLVEEDLSNFVNIFCRMCNSSNDQMRIQSTYNFPAVAACVTQSACKSRLVQVIEQLSKDSCTDVRIKLAAGFHELLGLINLEHQVLESSFLRLFADPEIKVRERLVVNLNMILNTFDAVFQGEKKRSFSLALAPLITNYERSISLNWRKLDVLVSHYELFPSWFTVAELHKNFIPVLIQHLSKGAAALNRRIGTTVSLFLSTFETDMDKAWMLNTVTELISTLSGSKSHATRIAFVDLCEGMLLHFSGKFFGEYLLPGLLKLKDDPVPNVRLHLLKFLPTLRSMPAFQKIIQDKVFPRFENKEQDVDVKKIFAAIKDQGVPFDAARDKQLEQREGDLLSDNIVKLRVHLQQEAAKEEKEKGKLAAARRKREMGASTRGGSAPRSGVSSMNNSLSSSLSGSMNSATGMK